MKRAFGLLGFGLLAVIALGASKDPLIEGGKIHYRDGRFEKADTLFVKAIAKGVALDEAYMWHGMTSVRLNNPAEAARAFLHVLSDDPTGKIIRDNDEAPGLVTIAFRYGAIELFNDTAKADTVVLFLKNGISFDPKDPLNYVLLGRFYLQGEKFEEAEGVANDLEKVLPKSPQIYYIRARVSLAKEEYEKAINEFNKSIELYRDELTKQEENLASQLEVNTSEVERMNFALDSMGAERDSVPPAEKENFLTSAFKLPPPQVKLLLRWRSGYKAEKKETSVAYTHLGQAYFWNKSYPQADTALTEALKLDPKNQDAIWFKGFNYYYLRDYPKAIEYFEQSNDSLIPNPTISLYLGICYLQKETKDLEKAGKNLLKAEELDPTNPDVYVNLTVWAREKGDLQKASEYYKKAQELSKQGENQ
jgi:tetratricopeptide (TPR) repeat protein